MKDQHALITHRINLPLRGQHKSFTCFPIGLVLSKHLISKSYAKTNALFVLAASFITFLYNYAVNNSLHRGSKLIYFFA